MLKGEAKTAYQREYMRKMRSNKATLDLPVRPVLDPVVRPITPKKAKLSELQAMIHTIERTPAHVSKPVVPRYQWGVSKPGDTVRMRDGSVVTVPDLDGEGNPIGG